MRFSLRTSPVPTCRSSKYAIYIGGTSWSRPSAPYSVVTAPKKTKSTRSCPGGVTIPPFRPVVKEEQRFVCVSQNSNVLVLRMFALYFIADLFNVYDSFIFVFTCKGLDFMIT